MSVNPFAHVWNAFARGAPPPAQFLTLSANAVYRPALGGLVAIYNAPWSTPYQVVRMSASCVDTNGARFRTPLTLYAGLIPSTHAEVTTVPDGSRSDYSPPHPPPIPGGVPLMAIWASTATGITTAIARCSVQLQQVK